VVAFNRNSWSLSLDYAHPTDNPAFPLILSFDSDRFASTSGQTAYRVSPAGINFWFMVSGGLEKRVRFNRKSEKYEIVGLVPKE
jgi:hypothetical protein